MPFDEFTVHQIAGDMLARKMFQSKIATGFHRNTMLNEEGGIDPLEFRFYAMKRSSCDDWTRLDGTHDGCAQCTRTSSNPISLTEYYEFMAMLNKRR